MSRILEKLNQLRDRRVMTEIAFDLRSILERLVHFKPSHILIDDNIGREELAEAVNHLAHSKKTKDVPITLLKNSNYEEAMGSSSIFDYILKQNLSAESIYNSLRNTLKMRRTQMYLYEALKRRRSQLMGLVGR
ncbi:MAG: hypothetical protein HC859_01405 [Bacteroidia bacterium]|nr:hypothetical protein [Bacteroidia bacterium]